MHARVIGIAVLGWSAATAPTLATVPDPTGDIYSLSMVLSNPGTTYYRQSAGPDTMPFDAFPHALPTHTTNGAIPWMQSSFVPLGGGVHRVQIGGYAGPAGGPQEFYPAGQLGALGEPLTDIGIAIGLDDPLDFPVPVEVVAAQIFIYPADQVEHFIKIRIFNPAGAPWFTTPWDGRFVYPGPFGGPDAGTGNGYSHVSVWIDVREVVPAPGVASVAAAAGLVMTRRRHRATGHA